MLRIRTSVRPSEIHGVGLFAEEDVPEGSVIWERDPLDLVLLASDLADLDEVQRELVYEYGTFCRHLDTWCLCIDTRFMNHASGLSANVVSTDLQIDAVNIAAKKIRKGDELTIDYSTICDALRETLPDFMQ